VLKEAADLQTLAYMAGASILLVVQWQGDGLVWWLYLPTLALAFATSIMNHNHCHCPLWRSPLLNELSHAWFTVFQGHPGFVFALCHQSNHHRHRNRSEDWTRTWRRWDDNDLLGFLRHPFESVVILVPHIGRHLAALRRAHPRVFRRECVHYLLLLVWNGSALAVDPVKALLLVIVPQLFALFFLLAANYFQHAHTDEASATAHSRNFLGLVNPLFFNIGLHSAHHLSGTLHWSKLPALHARIASRIDPRVVEPGFAAYCLRVFILSLFVPACRSRSLRRESAS
jgi:fatty acid desaturase